MYCLMIKKVKDDCLKEISSRLFKNFEDAYSELRATLKELGLKKDSVFDGKSNIKEMNKYFKEMKKICGHEDWWSDDRMKPITFIQSIIQNTSENYKPFNDDNLDEMLTWKYKKSVFELYGDKEGPINGIFPIVKTNVTSMNKEHCYFYVNDNFGGNGLEEYSINELYIDLIKSDF